MPRVEIFGRDDCKYCQLAKAELDRRHIRYTEYNVSNESIRKKLLERLPGVSKIPQIFINGICIGGFDSLLEYFENVSGGFGDDF